MRGWAQKLNVQRRKTTYIRQFLNPIRVNRISSQIQCVRGCVRARHKETYSDRLRTLLSCTAQTFFYDLRDACLDVLISLHWFVAVEFNACVESNQHLTALYSRNEKSSNFV
jgi:hypothetical protein